MHEIFAFTPQTASWSRLENRACVCGFEIIRKQNGFQVRKGKASALITERGRLLETDFIVKKSGPVFIYPSVLLMEFGRPLCRSQDKMISQRHFRLEDGMITDLGSANGLYVNGRRIKQAKLADGDEIIAGTIRFTWHKEFISSSAPLLISEPEKAEIPLLPIKASRPVRLEPVTVELEPARLPSLMPEPDLFASIGSSAVIMLSMLLMGGISTLVLKQPASSMIQMMLSSVSMSFAFMGYGLISRKRGEKQNEKTRAQALETYENYLRFQKLQADEHIDQIIRRSGCSLAVMNELGSSSDQRFEWFFLLAKKQQVHAKIPHLSYDVKNSDWALKLEKTAQLMERSIEVPFEPSKGDVVFLSGKHWQKWLFEVWIRMIASGIGQKWAVDACFELDVRMKNHESIMQFERAAQIPEDAEIIFTSQPMESRKEQAVICLLKEGSSSDIVPVDFRPLSKNKVRSILAGCQTSQQEACLWKEILSAPDQREFLSFSILKEGKEHVLSLDEKKQGVHMLCAGTTGSGKSEFLSAMLLQFCLQADSRLLQFIIIDFKGGAMGLPFYEFPHFAGAVSNLNTADMKRFEQAAACELEKRQKKIASLSAEHPNLPAHIDSWNKIHPDDPMSHLMIFCDEFAQLKSIRPESMVFMKELARIGRSLGIHLILSTQKIGGVVDEQILANTDLKVCFKTSTRQDLQEMMGKTDAVLENRPGAGLYSGGWQQEPQPFQSLYTRQPFSLKGRWEYTDQPENEKMPSILEQAAKIIADRKEKGRLILPDFYQASRDDAFCCIDESWNQSLSFLSNQEITSISVLASGQDWILEAAGSMERPCYGYGFTQNIEGITDVDEDHLFMLEECSEPSVLFLHASSRKDLEIYQWLCRSENLQIILYSCQAQFLDRFARIRLAVKESPADELRCWLTSMLPVLPEGCMHAALGSKITLARFLPKVGPVKKAAAIAYRKRILGWSALQTRPIVLEEDDPLCIVSFDETGQAKLKALQDEWKKQQLDDAMLQVFGFEDIKQAAQSAVKIRAWLQQSILFLGQPYDQLALALNLPYSQNAAGGIFIQNMACTKLERIWEG